MKEKSLKFPYVMWWVAETPQRALHVGLLRRTGLFSKVMHTKQVITKKLNDYGVEITEYTNPERVRVSKEFNFDSVVELERMQTGLSNAVKCIGLLLETDTTHLDLYEIGLSLESIGTLQNQLSNNGFSEAIEKLYKE